MLRPSAEGFKLDTRLFSAKLCFLDTWRRWRHTRKPAEFWWFSSSPLANGRIERTRPNAKRAGVLETFYVSFGFFQPSIYLWNIS